MSLEKFVKEFPILGRVIVKKEEDGHVLHDSGNFPFNKFMLYGRKEEVVGIVAENATSVIIVH